MNRITSQNIWSIDRSAMYRQERRAQATVSFLEIAQGDFILDVCCCEGFITRHLLKSSFVVGIDISKASLLVAKRNLRQLNVDFVCADATALPLNTNSFDKITLLEVLEHLAEEKQKTLCNEINSVLKKEGTLLISVPFKEQITYMTCIHCGKLTPPWGHLCSLDEQKISSLLSKNYQLTGKHHLHNVELISLSRLFKHFPFRLWILLNNVLGHVSKGYWIVLKYKKS